MTPSAPVAMILSERSYRSDRVTVLVPTWNEAPNVKPLLLAIERAMALAGVPDFEILVLDDDSPDGTERRALESGVEAVRVVQRRGRARGLAAAVIDGFLEAHGNVIVVLDGDLSHPPEAIPGLLDAIAAGAHLAIGSRYVDGGGSHGWPLRRRIVSRLACLIAQPLTGVRDSTSGFFALRREVVEAASLHARGFKIGLEVLLRGDHAGRVREVPYLFHDRVAGRSKFGARHVLAFLTQLASGVIRRGTRIPGLHQGENGYSPPVPIESAGSLPSSSRILPSSGSSEA